VKLIKISRCAGSLLPYRPYDGHLHCNDRYVGVPGYDTWWDVVVAEVSEMPTVQEARKEWEEKRAAERYFL
jgi:hypothetical protein